MSNNKQTAVEWLIEQLGGNGHISTYESIKRNELQSIIEKAKEMEKQQRKIELPSDEEIKEYINSTPYYGHCTPEYCEGIEDGIKWVINKIQGGNKWATINKVA